MIDNQQVKLKNKHSFFGLLVVCRSCFLSFVDRGGRDQKRQHGRADFGEVVRPAYPLHIPSYLTTYPAYPYMSVVPTYPHAPSNPIPHPLTT